MQLNSAAALLLTLSHALPNPGSPLGREARRLAGRLSKGASTPAELDRAASISARLLEVVDTEAQDPDLLDPEFDA